MRGAAPWRCLAGIADAELMAAERVAAGTQAAQERAQSPPIGIAVADCLRRARRRPHAIGAAPLEPRREQSRRERLQVGEGGGERRRVLAARDEVGAEAAVAAERIAADRRPSGAPRRSGRAARRSRPRAGRRAASRESSGRPPVSRGSSPATIASKTAGTPAITCTLPSEKPGALETGLSISAAPVGDARHAQPRRVQVDAPGSA